MFQSFAVRRLGLVAAISMLAVGPAIAQDTGPNATPAMLRREYLHNMKDIEAKFVGLAEAFPEEKYNWRPAPGVRSVAEVLMHVAAEHFVYMPMTFGVNPPADLKVGTGREAIAALEKMTGKATILGHLKASFAFQRGMLEGQDARLASGKITSFGQEITVAALFNEYIADQHEHLGQLIAYARMNGIVPPWSKKPN